MLLLPECEKLQMAITQQRVIRSTSCLVLRWGFRGRRIERRHFRLDQIQNGGQWPFLKKNVRWPYLSNTVTHHPIYFLFGSRLVFLARIALFNLTAHELHELYYDRPTSSRGIGQTLCSFEHVSCCIGCYCCCCWWWWSSSSASLASTTTSNAAVCAPRLWLMEPRNCCKEYDPET